MERRSFLKGALTLIAVSALPVMALAANIPEIVGDGRHDDTAGLNALFAGKPVIVAREHIIATSSHLKGGCYRISGPLEVQGASTIEHATFVTAPDYDGQFIRFRGGGEHTVSHCNFVRQRLGVADLDDSGIRFESCASVALKAKSE